jgi:hypothetical protein
LERTSAFPGTVIKRTGRYRQRFTHGVRRPTNGGQTSSIVDPPFVPVRNRSPSLESRPETTTFTPV